MYAGTTIRTKSGRFLGTHQQIDRLARRNLRRHMDKDQYFPTSREILHFEGGNGPDAIKRKSPAIDEPWHFIDPDDPKDRGLINLINDHIYNLSVALREQNTVRASFEAAWLAHAVTDGLTPAHHDRLDQKIEELWGMPYMDRKGFQEKNIIRGISYADTLRKNWEYWGTGGVFTSHFMFEWGVATTLRGVKYPLSTGASKNDVIILEKDGFESIFLNTLRQIHSYKMYNTFKKKGWSRDLASLTREKLIPLIVKAVALAWLSAVNMSEDENAHKNR